MRAREQPCGEGWSAALGPAEQQRGSLRDAGHLPGSALAPLPRAPNPAERGRYPAQPLSAPGEPPPAAHPPPLPRGSPAATPLPARTHSA